MSYFELRYVKAEWYGLEWNGDALYRTMEKTKACYVELLLGYVK